MNEEVSRIRIGQNTVQEELISHRSEATRSHARILQIEDGQYQIITEQQEARSKMTEAGMLLLNAEYIYPLT
jgi:hypothetical protein